MALLYAIPCLFCGLLYSGLFRMFGTGGLIEMGLVTLIIATLCAILTPVAVKLSHSHRLISYGAADFALT